MSNQIYSPSNVQVTTGTGEGAGDLSVVTTEQVWRGVMTR